MSNMHFMSARFAGSRQMRRYIGHVVKSGGIVYGCPVFLTFTPSERQGMLHIHLFRARREDTALLGDHAKQFRAWIGHSEPSLYPKELGDAFETMSIEVPAYDLRRAMTGKDPLCCVLAFQVIMKHVLPSLYG